MAHDKSENVATHQCFNLVALGPQRASLFGAARELFNIGFGSSNVLLQRVSLAPRALRVKATRLSHAREALLGFHGLLGARSQHDFQPAQFALGESLELLLLQPRRVSPPRQQRGARLRSDQTPPDRLAQRRQRPWRTSRASGDYPQCRARSAARRGPPCTRRAAAPLSRAPWARRGAAFFCF